MRKKRTKLSKAQMLNRQIESWERKQEGAVIMLRKSAEELLTLRRKRRRMLERETVTLRAKPVEALDKPSDISWSEMVGDDIRKKADDDDIPTFLDRTGKDKDAAARAEIEAEQAAQKKAKAERRVEKIKIGQEIKNAELTGQRRKMPLTGRAALNALK